MRIDSLTYYTWKNKLNSAFETCELKDIDILEQWGINSKKSLYVKKFINLLCRPGRNSDKFELNNSRFYDIYNEINLIVPQVDPLYVFTTGLLNSCIRLTTVYTRQGSINTPRKIFLLPNVIASVTLRKCAEFARSMTPKLFAQEIKYMYTKDNKSKLITFKNDQHRIACAGTE